MPPSTAVHPPGSLSRDHLCSQHLTSRVGFVVLSRAFPRRRQKPRRSCSGRGCVCRSWRRLRGRCVLGRCAAPGSSSPARCDCVVKLGVKRTVGVSLLVQAKLEEARRAQAEKEVQKNQKQKELLQVLTTHSAPVDSAEARGRAGSLWSHRHCSCRGCVAPGAPTGGGTRNCGEGEQPT